MENRFHILQRGQINLISTLMRSGRKYRIWPTSNGGLAILWQSRTGLTLAATNARTDSHAVSIYLANAPFDNWTRGAGAHGIEPYAVISV